MYKKVGFLTLVFLIIPTTILAANSSVNTGFINDTVWFSDNYPTQETRVVDVYTAIFNGEAKPVEFAISLKDNNVVVQTKSILISPKKTKTASFAWNVGKGKHVFVATIDSAKTDTDTLTIIKDQTKSISLNVGQKAPIASSSGIKPVKYLEEINFKPGSPEDKGKVWLIDTISKIDKWRIAEGLRVKESLAKVKSQRASVEDEKPAIQGLSFLHMWGLMIAGFILSFGAFFYILSLIVAIWFLKKIFHVLQFVFRRRER